MSRTDHRCMCTRPLRLLVAQAVLFVPLFGLVPAAHAAWGDCTTSAQPGERSSSRRIDDFYQPLPTDH